MKMKKIVDKFKSDIKSYDFCASPIDDAWCDYVSPKIDEFICNWTKENNLGDAADPCSGDFGGSFKLHHDSELFMQLHGIVVKEFMKWLNQ